MKKYKDIKWQENYKLDWCDRLLYYLRLRNIKRMTLANGCGVSYSALTLWLTRKRIPSLDMIVKMALVLEISPAWLIFGLHTEDYFLPEDLEILDLIKSLDNKQQFKIKRIILDEINNANA